jgi:hypothetical protein
MVAFQVHSRIGVSFKFTLPVMSLTMVECSSRLSRWITRLPAACSIVEIVLGALSKGFASPAQRNPFSAHRIGQPIFNHDGAISSGCR